MYLDHLHARYAKLGRAPTRGCTIEQLHQVEQDIGFPLPQAYREFLLWVGEDAGDLFGDLEDYAYHMVPAFQGLARMLVQRSEFPVPLPEDAIVFFVYDSCQFEYIRAYEGDDPMVYFFAFLPDPLGLKLERPKDYIAERKFSEWLEGYVEFHEHQD